MKTLQLNYNYSNLALTSKRISELRIGYMDAVSRGFFLNSLETGATEEELTCCLLDKFNCKDVVSTCESFQFLINEGDRTSFQILLPYLLSTESLIEFEIIIRERFFGVERFIQQGKNLYNFLQYVASNKDSIVSNEDLEKGIIAWDMGLLIGLARAARERGYITQTDAWQYLEIASELCSKTLHNPQEIDKSFLIGKAMNLNKTEDWEQLILCYSLVSQLKE